MHASERFAKGNGMKLFRKFLLVLFVTALTAPVVGCAGGVGTTRADSRRTFNRIVDYDQRMLADDLALFFQTNRTLRTSRWVID